MQRHDRKEKVKLEGARDREKAEREIMLTMMMMLMMHGGRECHDAQIPTLN
jgi:hypothetical protein